MTEPRCIFCRIVEGEAPAHVVWSDAEHVAFLDVNPITAGHVLLVTRAHVTWVDELSAEAHARLFVRVRELARPVAAAAAAPHIGIAVEGYGVPHAHVHLVPVWRGGDLDPCRQAPGGDAELRASAERVRATLAEAARQQIVAPDEGARHSTPAACITSPPAEVGSPASGRMGENPNRGRKS